MPENRIDLRLHVTKQADRGARRKGVVGHKSRTAARTVLVDGIRCSDPIEAWCECAELLGVDDLVVLGDGLVRRKDPLATMDELRAAAARRAGARGVRRLRTALDLIRPGTDSARETLLRLVVVRAGFPEPLINHRLTDDDGLEIGHGDLVWPEERIVLEYEGRQHAEDARQFALDIRRIDRITEHYRHIRVDKVLLSEPDELLAKLRRAFRAARSRTAFSDSSPTRAVEGTLFGAGRPG